jgi:non-specific serine/threonine protein kinase
MGMPIRAGLRLFVLASVLAAACAGPAPTAAVPGGSGVPPSGAATTAPTATPTPAPTATATPAPTAVAFDGRVWVIGGRWASNLGAVEAYDPRADTWTTMPDLPEARGGLTAAVLGDRIHVTGGEEERRVFRDHDTWDAASGAWLRFPELPAGRHGLASGVIDGRWIVAGGGPNPDLSGTDRVDAWTPH